MNDNLSCHTLASMDATLEIPVKNQFRLVILGSSKSGKSSVVQRFLRNDFRDSYTPTIEDFHRKLYRIKGDIYQLDIIDTSGYHPFPAMRRLSFLTGDMFLIVFALDNRDTYEEAKRVQDQILECRSANSALSKSGHRLPPVVVVGNKLDRCDHRGGHRQVETAEVERWSRPLRHVSYVECSAKKAQNIDSVFYELFVLSNLPKEMSPSLHKKVTPERFNANAGHGTEVANVMQRAAAGAVRRGLSIRRPGPNDALSAIEPHTRRPSLRTEMLLLRNKEQAAIDNRLTRQCSVEAPNHKKCTIQ